MSSTSADAPEAVTVTVDGIAYGLTPFGGLIRYWDNLLSRLSPRVSLDFIAPVRFRASPPCIDGSIARTATTPRVFHSTYFTEPPSSMPTVVTVHDLIYEAFPDLDRVDPVPSVLDAKRRCIRSADAIVTPSRATADLLERWHAPTAPVAVIPHGIDQWFLDVASNASERLRPLLRRRGIERPFIAHLGGRHGYKDFRTIIQAYLDSDLAGDLDLVVVGSEPDPTDSERALLGAHGRKGRVVFLGPIPDDLLAGLVASADVVVSASTLEGFGLPLVEALAVGTPVACTQIPAHIETVGDHAHLFPVGDPTEAALAIRRAIEGGRMSHALRQDIRGRHDWERSADQHIAIYRQVAGR